MFRDEREALRARAEMAEAELAEVRRENERLRAEQERALAREHEAPPSEPPAPEEPRAELSAADVAFASAERRERLGRSLALRVTIVALALAGSVVGLASMARENPAESVIAAAAVAAEIVLFAAFEAVRVGLERRDETWWVFGAIRFRVARAAMVLLVAAGEAWMGLARNDRGLVMGALVTGFAALCVAVAAFAMPEDMTW